ncbi:unnamed protein product, partial [Polarella glacialis]
AKMDELNVSVGGDAKGEGKGRPVQAKGKSKGERSNGQWTLDLRPRILKLSLPQGVSLEGVRDELRKLGAGEEQ